MPELGKTFVGAILNAPQVRESEIRDQRIRVAELKTKLLHLADKNPPARDLLSVVDHLVRRSIWAVGGDGWAYDIGYGAGPRSRSRIRPRYQRSRARH